MKLRKVLSSVLILLLCACTFMPSVAFAKEDQKVWVGGCVIGIELNVDGIAVVGEKEGCKLIVGDVIKSVDNVPVNSVIELKNALKTDKEEVVVKVLREGKLMEITCPLSLKKGVKTLVTKKTKLTIKKLKSKKTYYFKICAFDKKADGTKVRGSFTKVVKVKVK